MAGVVVSSVAGRKTFTVPTSPTMLEKPFGTGSQRYPETVAPTGQGGAPGWASAKGAVRSAAANPRKRAFLMRVDLRWDHVGEAAETRSDPLGDSCRGGSAHAEPGEKPPRREPSEGVIVRPPSRPRQAAGGRGSLIVPRAPPTLAPGVRRCASSSPTSTCSPA